MWGPVRLLCFWANLFIGALTDKQSKRGHVASTVASLSLLPRGVKSLLMSVPHPAELRFMALRSCNFCVLSMSPQYFLLARLKCSTIFLLNFPIARITGVYHAAQSDVIFF